VHTSGGDYLAGGTGNDSLVSNGGKDVIVATAGSGDTINAGTGGDIVYSTNAADVITGTVASLNPTIPPGGPVYAVAGATLPTGGDGSGPWAEYGIGQLRGANQTSAGAGGVSNTSNTAIEPALAAGANGQFVAWSDNRSGTYEIYVAQHTNGAWQELAGSAHGGGISATAGDSRRPAIALDSSGNPIVVWTTYTNTSTDIEAAHFDPTANGGAGGWMAMGSSLSPGGMSSTGGADDAKIVETTAGPVVTWLDSHAGNTNIYAAQYAGGAWSPLGAGATTGHGISNSADSIHEQSLATDGTNVAVAWTRPSGASGTIYLLEYTNGAWTPVNGSASGGGVSGVATASISAAQPTVAFANSALYVAWQKTTGAGEKSIAAATSAGGTGWQPVSIDSPGSTVHAGANGNFGASSQPMLSSGGGTLELTWVEARLANTPGQVNQIYANTLNGTAFVRQLPDDAMFDGVNQTLTSVSSPALAVDGSGHAFITWGDASSGHSQIYLRGNPFTPHKIYYVNDAYTATDSYTTAAGSSSNSGVSASSPLDSVQSVLADYTLGAGDVILVDSGSYSGFTVPSADAGFTIIGSGGAATHFTSAVNLGSAAGATLESLALDGGLTLNNSSGVEIRDNQIVGITVTGGAGVRIEQNTITGTGLTLTGEAAGTFIADNTIAAIAISGTGATGVNIVSNRIGRITLSASSQSGTISGNNIGGASVGAGIAISDPFTGSIDHNYIHGSGSGTGVVYAAGAALNANYIFGEAVGVVASVNDSTNGLGFVGSSIPNEIFDNTTGVQLTGLMQNQHIHANATGVIGGSGAGTLGGTSLDAANVIEDNQVGINFNGVIQYNRIDRNQTTITIQPRQLIAHNLIYQNAVNGVETAGAADVRIINNTFYSTSGNNVLIDGGSSNVQLLNNIMRSDGGYDLYVNTDSRGGFFSDYNDLFTTGGGKIVHWLVDFTDILDWQQALGLYDLHSIGSAAISATEGDPRLFAAPSDDMRLLPLVNGLRSSSTASGSADPATDIAIPSSEQNLLANPSFENGVNGWSVNVGGATQSSGQFAFDGSSYFYAGAVASGFAEQTINLASAGFTAGQIDGQTLALEFGGRIQSGVESIPSQGQIVGTFLDASNNPVGTPTTLTASNVSDRWELVSTRLNIPAGARSFRYHFQSLRQTGSADDSYLDNAFIYVQPNTLDPDMGAYGNTPADIAAPKVTRIQVISPDLYTDWELDKPHAIQWTSYGNNGGSPVNIDLYQNGTFLTSIAASTPDTGSYSWIPQNTAGLTYGMHGLSIRISLANNPQVYDRSTENFTIPENGSSYYVNDASQTNDVYTTAIGSNRNDGKLASAPKPMLSTLLRIYDLGGSDTVYVDTGNYADFAPIVLSGNPAIGKDQGVTITGPTNTADVAQINGLGFSGQPLFDINNANFVTLSHLTIGAGQYGVWVHDASSNFSGKYLTTINNVLDGIRLEADSSANDSLDHIVSYGNGRDGISVGGPGVNLSNSIGHNNLGAGIRYDNAGAATLTGNQSYLNKDGLVITNTTAGTTAVVGASDLTQNLGNIFHDNATYGVNASGAVSVVGNTVYDTASPGGPGPVQLTLAPATGQYLPTGSPLFYRVTAITSAGETAASPEETITLAAGNSRVALTWTPVPGATAYNVYRSNVAGNEYLVVGGVSGLTYTDTGAANAGTEIPGYNTAGINLLGGATAGQNVVYTNYLGIYSNGGAISNNRVFDNAGTGIYASNSANAIGNVSYSNAVGIEGDTSPTWSNNLIYANLVAGIWLHSGFAANITNNTIYQPAGDGIRVESSGGNFSFQHVNIRNNIIWTQNGYDLTVTPQAEIGFQSDYNDLYVTGSGQVGLWEGVSRPTLAAWHSAGLTDGNSISADPLFVKPAGADGTLGFSNFADHGTDDDFHEQSIAGSFHGGSLAPVVNGTTGLPAYPTATLMPDAVTSPAVDRGDPASSYANEPAPNGGFVNLGAYGDSAQASESFIPYVVVLRPNGGEAIVEGQTITLSWRSEDTNGTTTLDLMSKSPIDGSLTLVTNIATVPNNGSYSWSVPNTIAPGSDYVLRVTRNGPPSAVGTSAATFAISGTVHTFYVNDATVQPGDFTTAPGNDANSGLDPAHPKASIQAMLEAYNLGAGDVIEVDEGTYTLSSNIVISAAHSGVTIRGFHDSQNPTHVALINRNSTVAGSYVFDIQGAINVTLDQLSVVGGDVGVNANPGAGGTGLTVSNSDLSAAYDYEISLGSGNGGAVITGNKIHDTVSGYGNGQTGIITNGDQVTISNNAVFNNSRVGINVTGGNNSTISDNTLYSDGVGISADTSTISGNIAYNDISAGIVVGGASMVTGNTTYNIGGANAYPAAGIQVYSGTVQGNISYGNAYGVFVSGAGTISNNLLYNNSTAGIVGGNGSTFSGNVIDANGWGIQITSAPNAASRGPGANNNLIYGNTNGGIQLNGGDISPIDNNTIYQTTGDAIDVNPSQGYSTQVDIRNNILWVTSGYDISVDPNSQSAATSDYNDLYTSGTGKIGVWQTTARSALSDWQLASLQDANSISTDPLFVNPAGGDFHEQSLYGSYHGGSLAPVLDAATGLPIPATATLTDDAKQSPTIDLGDPTFAYANEPAPNGGYINMGAFGNTAQASQSPSTYVLVTKPNGGENWIGGQSFNIQWRSDHPGTGLVDIDLMHQAAGGGLTLQTNIAAAVPNNGQYAWSIPSSIPGGSDYVIRVTREGAPATSDISNADFTIAAATHIYYVNDSTVTPGDWTAAPGNDANSGIDPAHPKASITGVLSAYTLSAGDTIKVDAGNYSLNGDIVLKAAESGITIEGYFNPNSPTEKAVLNRGNTSSGAVFTLDGASNVTIDHLGLTGALYGLQSTYQVASNNATVSNCEIFGDASYAIYLIGGADNFTLMGSNIHNDDQGISGQYISNITITNNIIHDLRLRGISISSNGGTITGNEVYNVTGVAAIEAYGGTGLITVGNNLAHDNTTTGIIIGNSVLGIGNKAYNQTNGAIGIQVAGGEARGNLAYGNATGISVGAGLADQNRVYDNYKVGISVSSGATASQNDVYSNGIGIQGDGSPTILNNLVYSNTTLGIWITNGVAAQVISNTVYQPTGDAIDLLSSENNFQFQHMKVSNNILWAQAGYDLNFTDHVAIGLQSDYNDLYVTGAGNVARISTQDYPALSDWTYEYGFDAHSISADPQFVNINGADGLLGYTGGADRGADDNFHLQSTSPAFDAGDPTSVFVNEPSPNGGRINLGNFGDTPLADPSPSAQSVQITSPGSYQKLEVGHPYTISWQTAGVVASQPALLINAGGPAVGIWSASAFNNSNGFSRTITNTIDTSGVTDPAPQAVYQSYIAGSGGLSFQLAVPDGSYNLRLHFMDDVSYLGKSVFNIEINGVVVKSAYDLYADAGAAYKVTALSFPVTASGGTGLSIALTGVSGFQTISAIELDTANPNPMASPMAQLQVSTDSGATWTTIADNQPIDGYARGSFQWTPTIATLGATALFRVSIDNATLAATSQPFAISNGGTDYYVNDSSQTGDSLTTAIGNNANSGKSPGAPMADIQAVLADYNPGAGDTIHVDAGTYNSVHDINLTAINSGLVIEGPSGANAIINRANVNDPTFNFMAGASNITLDHLSITGGSAGVFADYTQNALNNTISNDKIFGDSEFGVYLGQGDNGWTITANSIHDNSGNGNSARGIDVENSQVAITNNNIFNEAQNGIYVADGQAFLGTITGNVAYANGVGIQGSNVTVTGNSVYNNSVDGIYIGSGSLAVGNTVFRQTAASADGILLIQGAEARSNVVYYNYNGIAGANSTVTIDRNSVYSNTNFGVYLSGSNGSAIDNLIYANSAAGIVLTGSNGEQLYNNTVYQLVGDAIRLTSSPNVVVHGNILWVEAGDDLNISADSQAGFISDYNDLHVGTGASANVGYWNGATQAQLSNWQAASGQDVNSISADPQFVNVKGADQVLGFSSLGVGYNGGPDDNFYLSAGSPAIDHGYSWGGYPTDILYQSRVDDPGTPNAGSPNYVPADTGSSQFAATGTAQNWRAGSGYWNYSFPTGFSFPFYGASYTKAIVSVNGFLQFAGPDDAFGANHSDASLLPDARIAPFWANLRTDLSGDDIFIDTSALPAQLKFTWKASSADGTSAANFSVVLFSNGQIRFDYGAGNAGLSPTVGISMGDRQTATFLNYDNSASLNNANSMLIATQPGFVDMGAYEFAGSSADKTPPTITGTTPSGIGSGGSIAPISQIGLTFSKPINPIDATAPQDYQLIGASPDGVFGTADDVTYILTPQYSGGSSTAVTLDISGGTLPNGAYRLTAYSTPTASIHDLSGNELAGDGTHAGTSYVTTFSVAAPVPQVLNTIVGDGTAQRSEVRSFTVAFSEAVTLAPGAITLALLNTGGSGSNGPAGTAPTDESTGLTWSSTDGGKTYVVTFNSNADATGSLKDGIYTLIVHAAKVTDAATGLVHVAADTTVAFHRLFGDINGDKTVNLTDYRAFKSAYLSTSTNSKWNPNFDVNGDGTINLTDYRAFKNNYLKQFIY